MTVLKAIVHRGVEFGLKVLFRYYLQWRKATVGWLQRATCKKRYRVRLRSIVLLQNCKMKSKRIIPVLKCKKCFLLRKLKKMSNLIIGFSEFLKFLKCPCKEVAFLSENWKRFPSEAVSTLQFFALEMRERKANRKQTASNVSVSPKGLRFRAWPIQAWFQRTLPHDYLQILTSKL